MKKIAVGGALAFVATFLLLMLWWPSWAFGANVTYVWRLHLPQVPAKHTVTIYRNFVAGAEQVLTPGTQQAISTTIPDSTFNYAEHRIWWYDTTDAPTTFYQTYCRTRISIADSNQMSYVAGYGGNTADTAVVLWYRNQSALAYAEDAALDVDSLVSTRYVLDTAQTRIISRANFGGQWVQSEIMICPASSQLIDTLIDSTSIDTLFVIVSPYGVGSDTVTLYAVDTSASPDSTVPYSLFTIRNSTGSRVLSGINTYADGYRTVYLNPGSYTVTTVATGYFFPSYSLTVAGDNDSVAVPGYDTHSPNRSFVYGYLRDIQNTNVSGLYVYAKRSECLSATADSSSIETTFGVAGFVTRTPLDTGYFSMSLIKSTEYDNAECGYYDIWCAREGSGEKIWELPKVWLAADLNVMDSLARRR